MQFYEALVKRLEGAGVTAFGGSGENVAGLMLAFTHAREIRSIMSGMSRRRRSWRGFAMCTDRLGVSFAAAGPDVGGYARATTA